MDRVSRRTAYTDEHGYAMAVLLVAVAVMLVLMSVAMPVWRQQQKREREEELLFRLKQYAHALALYQRKLPGAAPPTIDDLVKQRFLRRKYLDPMTGKEFAVLRVGQVSPGMTSPLPGMPNAPGTAGGSAFGTPAGRQTTATPGIGSGGRPSTPGPTMGGGTQTGAVGGIRGVVSTSKESSLRVWKGRTQYDQWEVAPEDITPRFFGVNQDPQDGRPGQPGRQNRPGQPNQRPDAGGPTRSSDPYGSMINRPRP